MFRNKKIALLIIAMLMLGLLVACGGGEDAGGDSGGDSGDAGGDSGSADSQYISIATGGTGGTYYPLGGALANILNNSDMGVEATAQATGASVENVELIHNGDAEVAYIQNDISYYAYEGIELFDEGDGQEKREYKDIRGLATLYPEVIQIIADDKSGIESVDDMVGKKIAVGDRGSGTEVNARQILGIHGISYDDLGKTDYLSFKEATDQIKNGQIDAAFVTAAIPSSSVTELATTHDIHLVPVTKEKADELIAEYPYYTYLDIDATPYGMEDSIPAVAIQAMLVVNENMSDDMAYNIVKNMFENLDEVEASHARGKDITLETALDGMSIELHPGAQKYFDEQGM